MTTTTALSPQNRTAARTFGILFIITFLSYGTGVGLIESIVDTPDFLSAVSANKSTIVAGVVLMALVHTFANIALPVIMFPILSPFSQRLALGYLGGAIAATIVLVVGAVFFLLLIPLSDGLVKSDSMDATNVEVIGNLLKSGASYSYHMGMALWSVAGLLFCVVLWQSNLIPRLMSVWGMFGYVILIVGSISELAVHSDIVETISVIPGGLFEVTLSLWLIIKGFNPTSFAATDAPRPITTPA